jgi:signal transduction histidine kinase/CheY-like chemotaxis protein
VHPDDAAATADAIISASAAPVADFETRLPATDGSWHWFSWSAAPGDGIVYAVGRDVTLEKERAAELEQAQEALRQSQKLESMGQLTGGVAHDFNNLLTPIIGSLDLIQRKGAGDERIARLIDGALQSAERAKTLVQRLLAFARRQPLQPTSVDLAKLVLGMAELVASTSGPRVKLVTKIDQDLPPVKADPNQLELALLNLSVNARDAMPDGGLLTIAAGREAAEDGHRSKLPAGNYVRLCVSDTGTGMDEATLRRAVEPFFSTKGVGKGTGLGLSMVHGLAAQLGGALTIQSEPGAGTAVELWLPISSQPAGAAARSQETVLVSAYGTALLVDDEDLVRASTASMLVELGYAVVEAASAEEALRIVEGGLVPDVVITDHLMPGMTGTALARTLRAARPELPVLIISGYAEDDDIEPDLNRLTKPFRQAELASSLAALPARRAGSRNLDLLGDG